jgi:hypothetical protein
MHATNNIPLGITLLLPCHHINWVDTLKAADPFIARDADMKLYPSITVEQGKNLSMFESNVESWDTEQQDMAENIIPYWRTNFIKQIQCTGNFKAKNWGTSLDENRHHFSHIY